MDEMERLRLCYDDYLHVLDLLPEQYSPSAGWLGFGQGPRDDPCHEQFYEALQEAVDAMVQDGISGETAREAVDFMLRAQDENQVANYGSVMLVAAHGQTLPFIPFLTPEDAGSLLDFYETRFPRRTRLPVQTKVCKALKKQAKGQEKG